ncbi:hypothetical protein A8H39_01635 [Paraburkholderia fungorum]|uniref:hypothetical protein n=1 Tax=Paraburkholderia fungorum TaxID=134537 RepID=UPI00048726A0|nr:hypothetical protein [Paraburkholderia fungorum]PNE59873.1 hypothetical protein A8H39_01635 [Paraburkholderia fungorum]
MNEDFAYSKRMHFEKTVKPAQRKERRELAIALVGIAIFFAGALDGDISARVLDHAAGVMLAVVMTWAMLQMSCVPQTRQDS